jgi:putative ABC transport system permease protein
MRSQIRRAVLVEALMIGILGSLIGLVAGFGIARGITALFEALGFGLPTAGARLAPGTVIAALLVGVVVTVVAAVSPARRATKIAPIAALREGAVLPRGFFARHAWAFGAGMAVLGAAAVALGFSGSGSVQSRLGAIAIGAFFIFGAVAVLARYVVRPIAAAVGWPLERLTSVVGRLARENSTRNANRTAVTSASLMIGLGLVVFVSIFAEGIKGSIRSFVNGSITADGIASSTGFGRLPTGVAETLAKDPGVRDVATARSIEVRIAGKNYGFTGVPARTFGQDWKLDWKAGSQSAFDDLGPDQVVLDEPTAKDHGWKVGTTLAMATKEGRSADLRIVGLYDTSRSNTLSGFLADDRAYTRLSSTKEADFVLFSVTGDTAATVKRVNLDLQRKFPIVEAQTRKQFTNSTADQLNPLIIIFYVLLALSVVISLFGIVNTLILSIFERTREIGMLRAVGITRSQMRRMVRYESVITAAIGGVLGLIVGISFGWLMIKGLESEGLVFSLPVVQIVIFFLLSIVAGVISAVLPARRAARMDVLQALQYE